MMNEKRIGRHRLPAVVVASVAALAAFLVATAPQPTDASWTVTKTFAVMTTAVLPAAPTGLSCPGSGLLAASVPFTWTAPAGTPPSSYTLKWTGAATGSSDWPTTSGTVASPLGTIAVSVYANYGSWQSAAGTQIRHANGVAFVGWTCGA
jgi:hypothetical protein